MNETTLEHPLAKLATDIQSEFGGARAELTQFPSGGAMLDVRDSGGRVFVIAHTPRQGYGVDEVQANDGLGTGYRFAYSDLPSAAAKLRELIASDSGSQSPAATVALNLVVVQSRDLEAAREFYECLGLALRSEQHGRGPQHYAAQVGPAVFEIYPSRADSPAGKVRIGFEVASLEPAVGALRGKSAKIVKEPYDSPWGRRAVVEDLDGNCIELTQRR